MASQGPLSPGTITVDASVGSIVWSTPTNAGASDNSFAQASLSASPNHLTQYLHCVNFGFSIPTGATIDGILVECEVRAKNVVGTVGDYRARIIKGGVIGSTDRSSGTTWTTTDQYLHHGGVSDLWGETWTVGDINSSTFGFALAVQRKTGSTVAQVDHVRIIVYYTAAAGGVSRVVGRIPVGRGIVGGGIVSWLRKLLPGWNSSRSGRLLVPQPVGFKF